MPWLEDIHHLSDIRPETTTPLSQVPLNQQGS